MTDAAAGDAFDVEAFHREAVETPSHEDVTAMRELLCETLERHGVGSTVDEAGNVLASTGPDGEVADPRTLPGALDDGAGYHLVLNTHVDTVPPHVPYERRSTPPGVAAEGADGHDGDVACGRGACDAKGPLAALLAAFLRVQPTDGRLTLAITPDEETHQTGAAHLRETLSADGFVVGEPTGLDVCTAARGQFEGQVAIEGRPAHAAEPDDGANPIEAVGSVVEAMATHDRVAGVDAHETLGSPTLTPTILDAGEAYNRIPATCEVGFDRRSVPPEAPERFRDSLERHVRDAVPAAFAVDVTLADREGPHLRAFATDESAPLVETLAATSGGAIRPFGAATEASIFARAAPTVVFGPGVLADDRGGVAHAEREYVRLSTIQEAADAVTAAATALVGSP